MSAHSGLPVSAIRVLFVFSTLAAGAGAMLYAWLWATVPQEGTPRAAREQEQAGVESRVTLATPLTAPSTGSTPSRQLLVLGLGALTLGAFLWIIPLATAVPWQTVAWASVVVTGATVTWMQVPRLFGDTSKLAVALAVLGGLLIVLGTVPLASRYLSLRGSAQPLLIFLLVAATLLVALVPVAVRAFGEATATRTQVAREAERAEIAAHLHDSVLQTLTLVRSAADDPARVRALTLRQERELRSWLYTGETEAAKSVAESLRQEASAVESSYGVPIEVVTVGDRPPTGADAAAIAAASEAMTNAVRHGLPPISVYQEASSDRLDIFVKDSGAGFDPDTIPPDRYGYRNSVVGRVQRAGGTVALRMRAGTEIHISIPHSPDGGRAKKVNTRDN